MPKVSVYLSDELYREVRRRGIALSALTQRAVEQELARSDLAAWVAGVRSRPRRNVARIDTSAVLDRVRSDFGE